MRKYFKQISIFLLCVSLVIENCTISAFASEIQSNEKVVVEEDNASAVEGEKDDPEGNEEVNDAKLEEGNIGEVNSDLASNYTLIYSSNNDEMGTVRIHGVEGEIHGELILPTEINGHMVTGIDYSVFYGDDIRGKLVIPEGYTFLMDNAFNSCVGITELVLPSTLKRIEGAAFAFCKNIKGDLYIPDSVEYLGSMAFEGCKGFDGTLHIPAGISTINNNTFNGCNNFKGSLIIGDNVKTIRHGAFQGCSGFDGTLKLPSDLTYLDYRVFQNCSNLKGTLTLPSGITEVEDSFSGCTGFSGDLVIPKSVTRFSDMALYKCYNIERVDNRSSVDIELPINYLSKIEEYWVKEGTTEKIKKINYGVAVKESNASELGLNVVTDCIKNQLSFELQEETEFTFRSDIDDTIAGNKCVIMTEKGDVVKTSTIVANQSDLIFRRITLPAGLYYISFVDNFGRLLKITNGYKSYITTYGAGFDLTKDALPIINSEDALNDVTYADKYPSKIRAYPFDESEKLNVDKLKFEGYGTGFSIVSALYNQNLIELPKEYVDSHEGKMNPQNWPDFYAYESYQYPKFKWGSSLEELIGYYQVWSYGEGANAWLSDNEERYTEGVLKVKYGAVMSSINEGKPLILKVTEGESKIHTLVVDSTRDLLSNPNGKGLNWKRIYLYDCNFPYYEGVFTNPPSKPAPNYLKCEDRYIDINEEGQWSYLNENGEEIKDSTSTQAQFCDLEGVSNSFSVTFDSKGGNVIDKIENVKIGHALMLPEPTKEGYVFEGWYTEKGMRCTSDSLFITDVTLLAKWKNIGLSIKGINQNGYAYSGKAIKPEFSVYAGEVKLTEGKDYFVSYKRNINAYEMSKEDVAFDSAKAPTIVVAGRGNFGGSQTLTFKINRVDISANSFTVEDIAIQATNRNQKPNPVIRWNGKIVAATGYSLQYFNADAEGKPTGVALDAVKDAGKYVIVITGNGNFLGERSVNLTLVDNQKLASKMTIGSIKNQVYTGSAIEPVITVKYGKTVLTKGTDYSVKYFNNTAVGTAKIVVTGMNDYVGTKTAIFKITGTSLTKATIEGISTPVLYTGNNIIFDGIKLYIKATKTTPEISLTKDIDYKVEYLNNQKAGVGTVVITGMNGYTGVIRKTFRINPFKLINDAARMSVELSSDSVEHCKGGAKPGVTVRFINGDGSERTLTERTDYVLSYTRNTAVNDCSNDSNLPTVKVTLKGSYTGTVSKTFKITSKDISAVTIKASDKTFVKKAGAYKSAVKLTDTDGKVLTANRDYYANVEYSVMRNGTKVILNDKSVVDAGKVVTVTVKAKEGGNYTGTKTCTYRITKAAIASTKVSIEKQTYSGQAIELKPGDIKVKIGLLNTIVYGTDYEIVPGSYTNNINKGTATVTIRGIGNYGGTKKVNFTIMSKGFSWWWS